MIWTTLFMINISQGLFLIPVILKRGSGNKAAARLISAMLAIIVITNFGFLVIRTELIYTIPHAYTLPFGMIFLFGPLFYLYVRSVTDESFEWKNIYWLHFIPYLIQVLYIARFFSVEKAYVIEFIQSFLDGTLNTGETESYLFPVQLLHLFIYLAVIFRSVRYEQNGHPESKYIIPVAERIKLIKLLYIMMLLFTITFLGLYIYIMLNGKYNPLTNYIYTIITSVIIYFIAYKLVFNKELIAPGFSLKYGAYKPMESKAEEEYLKQLSSLMEKNKIYLQHDLKLTGLAEKMGLPAHVLSRLINEKYGRTFNDFVNEYRVKEFISRLNFPGAGSFTLYAIALESGFNSKSSFNSAFKKITGKNPSDYKPRLQS